MRVSDLDHCLLSGCLAMVGKMPAPRILLRSDIAKRLQDAYVGRISRRRHAPSLMEPTYITCVPQRTAHDAFGLCALRHFGAIDIRQSVETTTPDNARRCCGLHMRCDQSRCATPARSSSSSASVLSIAVRLKSSTGRPSMRVYSPLAHVTGTPYITPAGIP